MPTCIVPAQQVSLDTTISTIPGDKSISHRAVIFGSLAENTSKFANILFSDDCLNTIRIFKSMGVTITTDDTNKALDIQGVGRHGLRAPSDTLDVGNSGTGIRLISGVLAGQSFPSIITGDHSIQTRPMKRILTPLSQMNAKITGQRNGESIVPPLHFSPSDTLSGITYTSPVASAQVKSCILLAGLYANGTTTVIEPHQSRDHTERMMKWYGCTLSQDGLSTTIDPSQPLRNPEPATRILIPSDPSSAAFFAVLGLLLPNSRLEIHNIGLNPTRARIFEILKKMGGKIDILDKNSQNIEETGKIKVSSSQISNIDIDPADIPYIIDEIPILAIAAFFGSGTLRVRDAKELRVKESDRIAKIVELITNMGGQITEYDNGFDLEGGTSATSFEIDPAFDHRVAMSAIIGALIGGVDAKIKDAHCINTSFPNFFEILSNLSINVDIG